MDGEYTLGDDRDRREDIVRNLFPVVRTIASCVAQVEDKLAQTPSLLESVCGER